MRPRPSVRKGINSQVNLFGGSSINKRNFVKLLLMNKCCPQDSVVAFKFIVKRCSTINILIILFYFLLDFFSCDLKYSNELLLLYNASSVI